MIQFIRKNIYKWHKVIGLITIIPVIFWCLSGLMHPFLAHWFKPKIANEFIIPQTLNQQQIQLSLKQVLDKSNIATFKNSRVVQFNGNSYYQVKTIQDEWLYFDTQSGQELIDGDKKYAEHLARYFLADSTSKIKSITKQAEFSQQYKYINRLLPVWKVSFDRIDNMDVYVETPYARLGTFNPTSRKVFLWIFDNFHNWTFLKSIGNESFRIALIILFLTIICVSSLSGIIIYGFMWGRFKKPHPENKKGVLRKYHRQIGISVALVSLTFAFSGGYHATRKIEPDVLPLMIYESIISSEELPENLPIDKIDWKKTTNISFVKADSTLFYQIFQKGDKGKTGTVIYLSAADNQEWTNGNVEYALFLANIFNERCKNLNQENCCEMSNLPNQAKTGNAKVLKTEELTAFEKREYGFAFKRLPVVRISYDTPEKTNLYIETATSRLAAKVENADRYEGYSFAILHKFLFMDWAGKNIRDIVMMLSALGVFTVSTIGLVLFLKK